MEEPVDQLIIEASCHPTWRPYSSGQGNFLRSAVDQKFITESVPAQKSIGDEVFTGTLTGSRWSENHSACKDNTCRVAKMVSEAQGQKPNTPVH